ncbi:NrfD/PsrC family molybdoenzyme membrane anchor subunit [Sulfurivermis fontis]|uniref:NrfD/PsrC family molybdoenzyme membrane anchor subunit n=1 Tax=Sulfurivermis fontis TaxID=1972068 RepID=UPI000FD83531|nr:NrfD/PsrC family molybdoenzyme membrane anchor subunit [Sulfurivermis fontis]
MKNTKFLEIGSGKGYYGLLALLGVFILAGLSSFFYMEHSGHWVTGMDNQIVWGAPHVFAIFLIVAASGALNVASIGTVFGKQMYQPLGRMSALLAIALLIGGLTVLVLDLGRPDRLIVAMTHYNFKSIFAWNIILYNGFLGLVAVYIWTMMDPNPAVKKFYKVAGFASFVWRLILTTGTGSIFGWLVARQAYDAAIMAPMFIVMSFSFGLAVFMLVMMATYSWTGRPLGDAVVRRLKNLLGVFIGGVLYFVMVYHLTNLYATEHHGVEAFILRDGGVFTKVFWIGQIFLGSLLPLGLLFCRFTRDSRFWIGVASALVILGGFAQLYVLLIGGQAYPLVLFPGYEVSSTFADGVVNSYSPSLPELVLGFSGIAVAMALMVVGMRVLRLTPASLADAAVDPHHK